MLLFSDLHLSPKTFETSMKVLRRVHQEALYRNIPVGFLGDFFDHVYNKGTLPVDILNDLLRYFADEWHVPMIMIPGNHDYFDASETEHGLTPFKYASNLITVLDKPTVIDNRLWVPWRRDPVVCKRIIDAHPSVDVIFGHFDIIGFKLNAKRVSTEGLSLEMFPSEIPVYTGHYHTPQSHRNVVYLGSPYQLTLSEAEDKKALILLDDVGNISGKIPIDIGRKQYKWTPSELIARSAVLKPTDRVSVTGSPPIELVRELREQGVQVDVKAILKEIETRIKEPEAMSEKQFLDEYAKIHEIDVDGPSWKILCAKLSSMSRCGSSKTSLKDVRPVRMNVQGFGPFAGPVSVPLQGQGFTLISGEMQESSGSNGAGKSMITAGALLWSFTGMIDGRNHMSFDGEGSVLHQGSGPTIVHLLGTFDRKPFEITRTLSANPRKHTITFSVDNSDRTRSTISATQRAISEEIFGYSWSASELWNWLLRNSCWSQQHVQRFCDASDSQAKQEIGELANMELWNDIHSWAKETHKETVVDLQRLGPEETMATENYSKAVEVHAHALRMDAEWQRKYKESYQVNRDDISKIRISLARAQVPDQKPTKPQDSVLRAAKRNLRDARDCVVRLKSRQEAILESMPTNWKQRPREEPPGTDIGSFNVRLEQCKTTMTARRIQLATCKTAFDTFKQNSVCSACRRSFDKADGHDAHLRSLQSEMEAARCKHLHAVGDWKEAAAALRSSKEKHLAYESYMSIEKKAVQLDDIEKRLQLKEVGEVDELQQQVDDLDKTFQTDQLLFREYHHQIRIAQDLQRAFDALVRVREAIVLDVSPYDTTEHEVLEMRRKKQLISMDACKTRLEQQNMKQIIQWTGPRGIQTYIMEHTVKKLGARTTEWLQRFFGPETHFHVGFDSKERLIRKVISPGLTGIMSGGQWRRVQIAAFLAWKSMKAETWPLLIMDECCTSMDQVGIESVQETLRTWCEEDPGRTCYFITHEPGQFRDTSIYQNHIRVQNKRGRSSLLSDTVAKRQKVGQPI
jgi:DNA repair exonuclease SbcCD nuclease subunit/ABC-type histidine transport system ATPase subunit